MTKRQATDVEVTPVNIEVSEELLAQVQRHDPKATGAKIGMGPSENIGIVDTPNGLFALCDEGVSPSHIITDLNPLVLDVYPTYKDGFGIMPIGTVSLTDDELREKAVLNPVTNEPAAINLAAFIRTFGSRLEANYAIQRRMLEQALAA